ncbi:hypothetical protein [Dyella koreensis]|uniref:Uncharacterized protein n=1 Tax=Dyella koreensis TaxID=311235 RepID=A0ABW8K9M1_9GAMM
MDYLIVINDSDPVSASAGYYPAESFEVVSDVTPPNWKKRVSGASVQVMPSPWFESNFFERLYDGDRDAVSIFECERDVILRSDP